LSDQPQQADDTTSDAPAADARPTRVLIAEDEALIRLDLKEMLIEEGFEVVAEVSDGATAVRIDAAPLC
jgi:two-component system, response regulator PdtaR